MGYKCAIQLTGLVRGEPKKGAKHRSNIRAICGEMGTERISASDTLDRSKTKNNQYVGYSSGFQCADDMTRKANDYVMEVKGKGGKIMKRRLREDAVIGCAFIINPPSEMCENWTEMDYREFHMDSMDFLAETCPQIFRQENIRMLAEHRDEGVSGDDWNYHGVVECVDETGRYCGNMVDAKLIDTINRTYPAFMRSRGWDLDDLDVTDWDRAKTDKAYKKEREAKRKKSGKSVNDYLSEKLAKKLSEAEQVLTEAEQIRQENERKTAELEARERALKEQEGVLKAEREKFTLEKKKWQEKQNTALQGVSDKERRLRTEIDTYRQKSTALDSMISRLREEKTEDEIQETVLEKCVYLWKDADRKVHKMSARTYAEQMRRRREQVLRGIERDLPELRLEKDYDSEYHL